MAAGGNRSHAPDWGALFVRYRIMALRFVQGIVGNLDLAEDLVQEGFRSVWERSQEDGVVFSSEEHARNYLFRALHNLAVDAMRSPHRRTGELGEDQERILDESGPLPQLEAVEERELRAGMQREITAALHTLKPREEQVVRMRYGEGLRYREIAERTGDSISTLQGRVETALNKIRSKLGKGARLS